MRDPSDATTGTEGPEPARARSESGPAATGETTSGDAARMEQAIDEFIRHDRYNRPELDATAFDALPGHSEADIVARLAPRRLDEPERLPRIVTSSLPIRPPPLPGDDRWRRQFIGALHNVDDDAPMPPALASYERATPAGSRRNSSQRRIRQQGLKKSAEPSHVAARWCAARRILAAGVATTCIFSTGALWAIHRTEMVAELGGQPARTDAVRPASMADAGATAAQPIRNTPVLIREGATLPLLPASAVTGWHRPSPAGLSTASANTPAPIVSRVVNVGEPLRAVPDVPIAPVVRVVPVVAIVPTTPIASAGPAISVTPIAPAAPFASVTASGQAATVTPETVTPDRSMADAVAPTSSQPPRDRDGLTERAARPAEVPAIKRKRTRHERPARTASVGRVSSEPFRSRGKAPVVARRQVPVDGWVMRRQSLRSEPEPEPSTLKKLISLVWPPSKWSATAEPSKPAAPAATKRDRKRPDSARANP